MSLSASGKITRRGNEPIIVSQQREITVDNPNARRVTDEVHQLRDLTEAPQGKVFRRLFWVWLRIFVRDGKERVNIRIPLPLPFLGALLPRQLYLDRSLVLSEMLQRSNNPAKTMKEFLDSTMAVEFIRVEDGDELVIIGLD